ncbi:hypothetical protein KEM55_006762 [Ascosphaera atra]|nr:hypothetical protein KEM55_006762 [Ascosphaera atra]
MSDPIVFVELTEEELKTKQIGSHNLQKAIEALHRDGLVVLKNAIDPAHLDALNARMVPEAEQLYARKETHRNFGANTGNIQQEPPTEPEYIFEDVIANPWATSILECMMGRNPTVRFYSANTAFKATDRQPVHIDIKFDFPRIPFGFFINVNLIDTTPENGCTELWPGSHRDTTVDYTVDEPDSGCIKPDIVEERKKIQPGIQAHLPKGSMIIRDFRLWHAGRPNLTDEPRVMLVTANFAPWYRSDLKFLLPKSLEGKIEWGNLVPYVDWVDDNYDYLQGAHTHDFSLKP